MASTREQALKTRDTNLDKDTNYYSVIGSIGGKKITPNTHKKGFGSMTPERRKAIAKRAGAASGEARRLKKYLGLS